jgi:NAD(P)-dependent dehydrogenase (short-subunit alcohol dehydrogenase family)
LKNIFVAGGGSGLGLEIVKVFLSNSDCRVIFSTSSSLPLTDTEILEAISKNRCLVINKSFSNMHFSDDNKEKLSNMGMVDIFVSSIGGLHHSKENIFDHSEDEYLQSLELNFHRPRRALECVLPYFNPERGQVFFINSLSGIRPPKRNFPYGLAKSSLRFYSKAISYPLGKKNISVINIALSSFDGPGMSREFSQDIHKINENRINIISRRPLPFLQNTVDIARDLVAFFLLDLVGMTGTTVNFDYGVSEQF